MKWWKRVPYEEGGMVVMTIGEMSVAAVDVVPVPVLPD